jgi:hypothetical protein
VASERVLMKAMAGERSVREAAALNPAATGRVLMKAARDEDPVVRGAAALHPRLPGAGAEALLLGSDTRIIALLVANEALPARIRVAARLKAGV